MMLDVLKNSQNKFEVTKKGEKSEKVDAEKGFEFHLGTLVILYDRS